MTSLIYYFTSAAIAEELGISEGCLLRQLQDIGLTRKKGATWLITDKHRMFGRVLSNQNEHHNSKHPLRWTELGRRLIYFLLERDFMPMGRNSPCILRQETSHPSSDSLEIIQGEPAAPIPVKLKGLGLLGLVA